LDPVGGNGNILVFLDVTGIGVEELVEIINVGLVKNLVGDLVLEFSSEAAIVGSSSIGVNGNFHTNVTSSNGGESTNEEGNGSVGEVGRGIFSGDFGSIDGEADNKGENAAEKR
jgi:hypothetical protein